MKGTYFQNLAALALEAKNMSYSPYSNFRVGSALLASSGKIYTGCNIESASYSPSNCAERTAFFKAVSEGERSFLAIAIAGDGEKNCYPCGVCRQVMAEFVQDDFLILIVKSSENFKIHNFSELLPYAFSPENLGKNKGCISNENV